MTHDVMVHARARFVRWGFHLGFPLGSLWAPFGFPLGSLWVPFGFPLGSLWFPFGFPFAICFLFICLGLTPVLFNSYTGQGRRRHKRQQPKAALRIQKFWQPGQVSVALGYTILLSIVWQKKLGCLEPLDHRRTRRCIARWNLLEQLVPGWQ